MTQKKFQKGKTALRILLVVSVITAGITGVYMLHYLYENNEEQKDFDKLKDEVSGSDDVGNDGLLDKYAALYRQNNDLAGWIKIDGTNIDYPVMYTPEDDDYYIARGFDKEYSGAGVPFVGAGCRPFGNRTDNVIIYGHNIHSGIMFHELSKLEDEDFYKEHKHIQFDTIYEEATYEVIAAFRTQIYDEEDAEHMHYYEFINATNKKEYDDFVNEAKSLTGYNIDKTAEYGEDLLTLSTCAYHTKNGRFVVVAVKVSEEE